MCTKIYLNYEGEPSPDVSILGDRKEREKLNVKTSLPGKWANPIQLRRYQLLRARPDPRFLSLFVSLSGELLCFPLRGPCLFPSPGSLFLSLSGELVCFPLRGACFFPSPGSLFVSLSREVGFRGVLSFGHTCLSVRVSCRFICTHLRLRVLFPTVPPYCPSAAVALDPQRSLFASCGESVFAVRRWRWCRLRFRVTV